MNSHETKSFLSKLSTKKRVNRVNSQEILEIAKMIGPQIFKSGAFQILSCILSASFSNSLSLKSSNLNA